STSTRRPTRAWSAATRRRFRPTCSTATPSPRRPSSTSARSTRAGANQSRGKLRPPNLAAPGGLRQTVPLNAHSFAFERISEGEVTHLRLLGAIDETFPVEQLKK